MGQVRVRQEIGRDGGGFVRERQFAGEVGGTAHKQDGAIGEGKWDKRQGFGGEEGA